MTEIEFINTRFDPDITPLHGLAKEMAKTFGYQADLEMSQKLAQLLCLRVAQINNCTYCLILHSKVAREINIFPAKIDCLGSWWESDLFGRKEKAALAYCDALTDGKKNGALKSIIMNWLVTIQKKKLLKLLPLLLIWVSGLG